MDPAQAAAGSTARSVSLVAVPFFHGTGCHSMLLPAVHTGATLVVMHKREPGEALREHLAQRVARFKIPAHIVVQSDELPRNASGKLVKTDIDLDQFAPDPAD